MQVKNDGRDAIAVGTQLAIQALIFYSLITMCLETVPELSMYQSFFGWSEFVVVMVFTVEYAVRWSLSKNKIRYPFQFFSIIDLLAILPFYLQFGVDLRMFRAFRFLRLFRVLKLARYSQAIDTLGLAVRRTAYELAVTAMLAGIIIVVSAMCLYEAEHVAQPEAYPSIPASFWSAVVTLTTVGYGDVYPVTSVGRFIASLIMLAGIGFIAIPAGLISSQLTEILRERRESPHSQIEPSVHPRESD